MDASQLLNAKVYKVTNYRFCLNITFYAVAAFTIRELIRNIFARAWSGVRVSMSGGINRFNISNNIFQFMILDYTLV